MLVKEMSLNLPVLFNVIHALPLGVCSSHVDIHRISNFLCLLDVLFSERVLSLSLLLLLKFVAIVVHSKTQSSHVETPKLETL